VRAADERDVRLEGEYDEFMNEVKGPQGAPAPWKTAAQGPAGKKQRRKATNSNKDTETRAAEG
jgi:hypothetical protein